MRQRFKRFFLILIVMQLAYFSVWLVLTLTPNANDLIFMQANSTVSILNFAVTLSCLTLYIYTITMLRRAISKCFSFQFETCNTYLIGSIFIFTLFLQVIYLILFEYMANIMVYTTLLHLFSNFSINVCIFVMLLNTGSGLVLIPH